MRISILLPLSRGAWKINNILQASLIYEYLFGGAEICVFQMQKKVYPNQICQEIYMEPQTAVIYPCYPFCVSTRNWTSSLVQVWILSWTRECKKLDLLADHCYSRPKREENKTESSNQEPFDELSNWNYVKTNSVLPEIRYVGHTKQSWVP